MAIVSITGSLSFISMVIFESQKGYEGIKDKKILHKVGLNQVNSY